MLVNIIFKIIELGIKLVPFLEKSSYGKKISKKFNGPLVLRHNKLRNLCAEYIIIKTETEQVYDCGPDNAGIIAQSQYQDVFARQHEPGYRVRFNQPYYMAKYPVTVKDFTKFVEETKYITIAERLGYAYCIRTDVQGIPCENGQVTREDGVSWRNPKFVNLNRRPWQQQELHPVVCIAWRDALAYIRWLNQTWRRPKKYYYILPSEAMWEVACRSNEPSAQKHQLFTWGNEMNPPQNAVNAASYAIPPANDQETIPRLFLTSDAYPHTSPIKACTPNNIGLHDMLGNVFEWCWDAFARELNQNENGILQDPWKDVDGIVQHRTVRGGSWATGPFYTRIAYRRMLSNTVSRNDTGFRVALAHEQAIPQEILQLLRTK